MLELYGGLVQYSFGNVSSIEQESGILIKTIVKLQQHHPNFDSIRNW